MQVRIQSSATSPPIKSICVESPHALCPISESMYTINTLMSRDMSCRLVQGLSVVIFQLAHMLNARANFQKSAHQGKNLKVCPDSAHTCRQNNYSKQTSYHRARKDKQGKYTSRPTVKQPTA